MKTIHIAFALSAALFAVAAQAQTPTQETGSIQSAVAAPKRDTLAPAVPVSELGLSAKGEASTTGSDTGPQPWKEVMGWLRLKRGMSEAEVLDALGPDYKEATTKSGKLWSYQDQKALLFGSVSFKDGVLENWNSPRF